MHIEYWLIVFAIGGGVLGWRLARQYYKFTSEHWDNVDQDAKVHLKPYLDYRAEEDQ